MYVTMSVDINAPPERAWEFLVEPSKAMQWFTALKHYECGPPSGPLGTDLVDKNGRSVLEASRPREFDRFMRLVQPREVRILLGAWNPDAAAIGLAERLMKLMPAARETLPSGDFRDWDAIDDWATEIAAALGARPVSVGPAGAFTAV